MRILYILIYSPIIWTALSIISGRDPLLSTPAIIMLHLFRGRSIFFAGLSATALAIAGVSSPSIELADIIPTAPMMKSALAALNTMAFSPVAPSLAPALSIFEVASELVPNAMILISPGRLFFNFSTTLLPMPPPWPSITATSMRFPPALPRIPLLIYYFQSLSS